MCHRSGFTLRQRYGVDGAGCSSEAVHSEGRLSGSASVLPVPNASVCKPHFSGAHCCAAPHSELPLWSYMHMNTSRQNLACSVNGSLHEHVNAIKVHSMLNILSGWSHGRVCRNGGRECVQACLPSEGAIADSSCAGGFTCCDAPCASRLGRADLLVRAYKLAHAFGDMNSIPDLPTITTPMT